MNTSVEKILSQTASVDEASVQPFTGSHKIYVQGSREDIRVPMREITLADTPTDFGGEKNPPVRVYDTSGPYTDPNVAIDLRAPVCPMCAAAGLKSATTLKFCRTAIPNSPSYV